MMSTVCHRFVQNAWKKERCSNCFKSREEHITVKRETPVSRRPLSGTKSRGILKAAPGAGRRKRAVSFKPELAEVIGYGGEEWEDVSEFELSEDSSPETSEDDTIADGDDDKGLEKLTKSNTELNANIAPATTTDRRRTFTQLMLGQPQKDAEGKKQTLLVSVTPFGQDDGGDRTTTRRLAKSTVSHIPIAKNNKDLLVETRSKVVLTGYTKNRESPELLTKPGLEKKQPQQQQQQQTNVAEENKRETVSNKDTATRREATTQAVASKIDVTTVQKTDEQQSIIIHEQQLTTQTVNETSRVLKTSDHKLLKTTEELTQQINEIRQNTLDLLQRSTTTSDVKQKTRETKTEEANATVDSVTGDYKQKLIENCQKTLQTSSDSKQLKTIEVGQETSDSATLLINGGSWRKECGVGDELKFDEDKCEVDEKICFVETRNNECSVRKVECHSVSSTISASIAVERNTNITTTRSGGGGVEIVKSNEPIVKSELSVQLRTPPAKRDLQVDLGVQQAEINSSSSSEESADSLGPAESREQAGEPDGRADPDVLCEPPALPRSPPPLLAPPPRSSFLHGTPPRLTPAPATTAVGIVVEKPKVPCKPDKVAQMVRKPQLDLSPLPMLPLTPTLDPSKLPFKRRAPNPPPTPTMEDITGLPSEIFTADGSDTVVIRSISMQEPDVISSTHNHEPVQAACPEPAPRKTVPVSGDHPQLVEKVDEKRKDKTRSRFSLKKFLRVGTSASKSAEKLKLEEIKEKNTPAPPKPRLVIVHPLELNGSGVEVVAPPAGEDHIVQPCRDVLPPAPPPRNIVEKRVDDPKPPPKSEETLRRQRQLSTASSASVSGGKASTSANNNNVYANLGECRSGLAPSKPQRTASMREREALLEQQSRRLQLQKAEHVYERITPRRHSDEANKEPRSLKCTTGGLNLYSGSEPDLELYAPCGSYYGSECEISEGSCSRPCRLRSRKGRSIVHRNLEDNYGAVVVANHEALAQVLEHLHLSPVVQPALRGLQSAPVLRWMDFSVVEGAPGVLVGRRAFHHALWGAHHITLVVCREQGASMHKHPVGPGTNTLVPITEFSDLVPARYLPGNTSVTTAESDLVQATVAVLPWIQVDTIQTLGASLKARTNQLSSATDANRDACFVLLQFVNSLKSLQAQGIEEIPLSLSNFILCHEIDRDTHHRLCLLQGFSEEFSRPEGDQQVGSLCQCALTALNELFTVSMLASLIHSLLCKESAMCLSQVKSILEFSLWGPADVAHGVPIQERELSLQRWLDLERATVLHGLVGTRVQLSVLEECHLWFLVRSSAKQMCEAALLLENNGGSS